MLDLAIIGGGPAGLTAGLYATRGGLEKVTMFEMAFAGGQIISSSEVENYPGRNEVLTGMDLMQDWPQQCKKFGLLHETQQIIQITKSNNIFEITLANNDKVKAKTVIMATGSIPRKAGFKGEDEFFGKGVSTCAVCDGFFYKNKEVVLLGGGDTAVEEAIFLSKLCSKVHIVHRKDYFTAAPATIKHLKSLSNIIYHFNTQIDEVSGDNTGITNIKIKNNDTNNTEILSITGIFVFVGRKVLNETLKQNDDTYLCKLNNAGEVVVDLSMKTSIDGLFAAGDIRIDAPKQVVCAAGDGATAALSAIFYINKSKGIN